MRKPLQVLVIVLAIWALGTYLTAGAMFAYEMGRDSTSNPREQSAFCVGWSALVVSWPISIFVTSFYEYGWHNPFDWQYRGRNHAE